MTTLNHLQTPDFPLRENEASTGPSHRMAHEIGCGAIVIRTTQTGHSVCLKLDRIGKEYIHHYLVELTPKPESGMQIMYIDPEDTVFDCFATPEFMAGEAVDTPVQPGHAFENNDGLFIKLLDDPKTQKMLCYAEPATGLVRIRQERKIKAVHPNWAMRAKIGDEIVELDSLIERFAAQL